MCIVQKKGSNRCDTICQVIKLEYESLFIYICLIIAWTACCLHIEKQIRAGLLAGLVHWSGWVFWLCSALYMWPVS